MLGITDTQNYTDIANAIRAKNGSATTYKPEDMAAAILAIPSGGGGLPAGYQQVEWVGSSATKIQRIDTLYVPNANTSIVAEVSFPDNTQTTGNYMGMRYWVSNTDKRAFFFGMRYNNNTRYLALFTMYPESTPAQTAYDTGFHTYNITPTAQSIDNNNFTLDYSNMPTDTTYLTFNLFASNYWFSTDAPSNKNKQFDYCYARIKSFKIYESGTLVRDFVPVYRKLDNEIGFYDLVYDMFYTNAGTGTFTKGGNV